MSVFEQFGMRCPRCQSDGFLRVQFKGVASLCSDGTVDDGDHEWGDDSLCACTKCGFEASVSDFSPRETEPLEKQHFQVRQLVDTYAIYTQEIMATTPEDARDIAEALDNWTFECHTEFDAKDYEVLDAEGNEVLSP